MVVPTPTTLDEALDLLTAYNDYIQEANEESRYDEGWLPVSIFEFYMNELSIIKEE